MPTLSDDFEVVDYGPEQDFTPAFDASQYDVLSEDEARRALYRPSRRALELRRDFQRQQEQQPDQSTILDRLALGAAEGASGLESSLGGLFNLAGLTGVGRLYQRDARGRASELQDASEALSGQNPSLAREWAQQFGGMAVQQAPSVTAAALSRGNRYVPAIVAGLQSAGSVQDAAEQAYEAQGLTPDDATSRARLPALVSGGITAALTALMPGGTERLAGMMFGGPAARNMAREGVYAVAKNIFKEAAKEAPEEMLDQLGQAAVARFSYDPEKPLDEILMETWEAGGWGVGTAGAVGTVGAGVGAVGRAMDRARVGPDIVDQLDRQRAAEQQAFTEVPRGTPENTDSGVQLRSPRLYPENPMDYVGRGVNGQQAIAMAEQARAANDRAEAEAVSFPEGFQLPADFEVVAEPAAGSAPGYDAPQTVDSNFEVVDPGQEMNASTNPSVLEEIPAQVAQPHQVSTVVDKRAFPGNETETIPAIPETLSPVSETIAPVSETLSPVSETIEPPGGINQPSRETMLAAPPIQEVAPPPRFGKALFHVPSWADLDVKRKLRAALTTDPAAASIPFKEEWRKLKKEQKQELFARGWKVVETRDGLALSVGQEAKTESFRRQVDKERRPETFDDRPFDILDYVESAGKLRKPRPDDTSDYAELLRVAYNATPEAFADVGGREPDDVSSGYAMDQGKSDNPEAMLDELANVKEHRREFQKHKARENRFREQDAKFQSQVVVGPEAKDSKKTRVKTIDQIGTEGTRWKSRGQRFEIVKENFDSFEAVDGPKYGRQTIPSGTRIRVDKGTVRKGDYANQVAGTAGVTSSSGSQPQETTQATGGPNNTPPTPPVKQASFAEFKMDKTRAVAAALMSSPALRGLNFQVEVTPAVEGQPGQLTEMGARIGNLVQVAVNADEKTLPHEVSHILFDALPQDVKDVIERARRVSLAQRQSADPRLAEGRMTSEEFQAAGLPLEIYPLSSPSEFLAHAFGPTFAQQALAKADPSLVGKLKVWLAEIWRSIKRALNLGNEMDRVVQDLIDGKLKFDPQNAARTEQAIRQASFVMNPQEATEEIQQTPANERQEVGESYLGQTATLVDLLEKHGATGSAFDFPNLQTIRDMGRVWNNGVLENYRQLKARIADQYQRNRLSAESAFQTLRTIERLEALMADRSVARAELNGPRIRSMTRKAQAAALSALAHEQFEKSSKAIYASAIEQASKALKEEAKTDLEMARLQGEIAQIREASQSSKAMDQLLEDMVHVLGATPEGYRAMFTGEGGPRGILQIYRNTKQAANEALHNENLLKWAAYLLSKSESLRDALHAVDLAKDSQLLAQLTGFQKRFADDLQQRPVQTIKRALREASKASADYTGAEFLFRQYQKQLLKEVGPLVQRIDNGDVAESVLKDPDFVAHRNEVLQDANIIGEKPAMPFQSVKDASGVIITPLGRKAFIGYEVMPGNQAEMARRYREYRAAEDEMDAWLMDPMNADDPRRLKVEMDLRMLRTYYASLSHLRPEARVENGLAFTVPNLAADRSGSRLAGGVRKAVRQMDEMYKLSRNWYNHWAHGMTAKHAAAMRSHGIEWGLGKGVSQREAHQRYTDRVFRELAGLWQDRGSGRGPQIGDALSSGEVVTSADMEMLRNQKAGTSNGLKLVEDHDVQFTEDAKGLKNPVYRKVIDAGKFMLPRRFNDDLAQAGGDVEKAFKEYSEALQNNPQAASQLRDALKTQIDRMWPVIGRAMVTHRRGKFAKATLLDGPAFEAVGKMFASNPMAVGNLDFTAQELAQVSTLTADEAMEMMLNEFGRIISQWSAKANEGPGESTGAKGPDTKNSFTEARGDALAPWVFYNTGFQTSDDVQGFAMNMMGRALDRVEDGFQAISADLERQESELRMRTAALIAQGTPNPESAAKKENEVQRANGETYDNWQDLRQRRQMIDGILHLMRNPDAIGSDFDFTFDRTAGALVGSLIGNFKTTMRNISGAYMGWKIYSLGMQPLKAALKSQYFTIPEIAKIAGSLMYSGAVKAPIYFIRGLARGVAPLFRGELSEAWRVALRDVIKELSETAMLRVPSIRDMVNAGVMVLPDKVAEFDNQMRVGLVTRGRLTARQPEGAAKAWDYLLGAFESTVLPVVNAAFPTAGDAAANAAMFNYVRHPYGPVRAMEKQLRKLYAEIKAGSPRASVYDFDHPNAEGNRLTHQELGMTADGLSKFRQFFEHSGLTFDEEAARFLGELEKKNPNAQFLADAARVRVADTLLNRMNRETFGNAPLAMKSKNIFVKVVRPLFGFNVRQFASLFSEFSIPQFVEGQKPVKASDLRKQAVQRYVRMAGGILAGVVAISTVGELRDQWISRMIARYFYKTESDQPWPWEQQTTARQVASFVRVATEAAPLVGAISNTFIPQNSPARASYEPTVVMMEAFRNFGQYLSGAVQAGDPRYGLAEFVNRFLPDAKIVVNRLPAMEGRRLANNAVAEIKRFAPPDAVRPPFKGGGGPQVTQLSPWIQRMDNAAQRNDQEAFRLAFREAVRTAYRMGKRDPLGVVKSAYRYRNPQTRALARRLTPQEQQETMRRASSPGLFGMGRDLSQDMRMAQRNWQRAGSMIGVGTRDMAGPRISLRAPSLARLGRGMARY